jgi:predicted GTPase
MAPFNCIVMGAAGRDFHDFLTFFAAHPEYRVRCFTAEQIPFIDQRRFPRELAPTGYDEDIPIEPESRLEELISRYAVDFVFLSYSDLPYDEVMHRASRVQAAGASFCLLGPKHTALSSRLPVIAVTATRTGAGKSPLSQLVAVHLSGRGVRVGVLRHPMPYGDLRRQAVQRFASRDDLVRQRCTIEEREEYLPYLELGLRVYAGVDYRRILRAAEEESDVILWDGGNNDLPFVEPGLALVVADALRPGHELAFYPGESNLRRADVVVVNKVDSAPRADVERVRANAALLAPRARIVETALDVVIDDREPISGKRALVIEDGPTITHGGMPSGAGLIAARRRGAEVVDPRPHAVGSLRQAYERYPHIGAVLPALGYSAVQVEELRQTVLGAAPDIVVDASPAGVGETLALSIPVARVRYQLVQRAGDPLLAIVDELVDAAISS